MATHLNISNDERAQINREIEDFFMFTEDVLADPSILEQMPDASYVEVVAVAERDPARHYDIETPNTVVLVTPVQEDAPPHRKHA